MSIWVQIVFVVAFAAIWFNLGWLFGRDAGENKANRYHIAKRMAEHEARERKS